MNIEQELNIWFYDIEIYKNYLLLVFKSAETGEIVTFESSTSNTGEYLPVFVVQKTLVGYNSLGFDDLLLSKLITLIESHTPGSTVLEELNVITKDIIVNGHKPFTIRQTHNLPDRNRWYQSIDLLKLTPLQLGLKMAGARLDWPKLQELPIPPDTLLNDEQKQIIKEYCINDVNVTEYVYKTLREEIEMRYALEQRYQIPRKLMSKGNAPLAETVLMQEYMRETGLDYGTIKSERDSREELFVTYESPSWIEFKTKPLQDLQNWFETNQFMLDDNGRLTIKDVPEVYINGKRYDCGVGGLHSKDCEGVFKAEEDYRIIDWDYSSFYPTLILQGGFVPRHLNADLFLHLYNKIVLDRIAAKQSGDKVIADALKIVINSTYGKFSEPFSLLYDPKATLQTTVTGQLTLLMLIEKMQHHNISCISANTDGATFYIHKDDEEKIQSMIQEMGKDLVKNKNGLFDFGLEDTHYSAIYKRDVNTYLAFTTNGKIKNKGALLSETKIAHNPSNNVCVKAIEQWVLNEIPFIDTIKSSRNLKDFLTVRKVKGGAIYTGETVGSIVRYYYGQGLTEPITYVQSGNKVPLSEGAKLVQDLPESFPTDIDYEKYHELTIELFSEINKPCQLIGNQYADSLRKKGFSPTPMTHKGKTLFDGDFSNTLEIGIQTGHKTGIMMCAEKLWKFTDTSFPQAYTTSNRKTGLNVIYGGVVPVPEEGIDLLEPLPNEYREMIYKSLTKPQRTKIDLANRDNTHFN